MYNVIRKYKAKKIILVIDGLEWGETTKFIKDFKQNIKVV